MANIIRIILALFSLKPIWCFCVLNEMSDKSSLTVSLANHKMSGPNYKRVVQYSKQACCEPKDARCAVKGDNGMAAIQLSFAGHKKDVFVALCSGNGNLTVTGQKNGFQAKCATSDGLSQDVSLIPKAEYLKGEHKNTAEPTRTAAPASASSTPYMAPVTITSTVY
ncbi:hypothetical protein BDB01DRAFT_234663 [Pilobolus umbonatus]|nr:hypothetical protein BDB01DRAFT_234663 [Pilobolus umbonatus]